MLGVLLIVIVLFLLIQQAAIMVWSILYGIILLIALKYGHVSAFDSVMLSLGFAVLLFFSITPMRRQMLSKFLMKYLKHFMPSISDTEQAALEAGTVAWDAELLSGSPDFEKLLYHSKVELTLEETEFLNGPVNELCGMLNDWDITHNLTDLPLEVWNFIKEKRFFGMIIPKKYGGLAFSATAQAAILVKIHGVSSGAASTISVPNSLGPAELLLKYGTEDQKNYYLPRLAKGIDIPCFALTGPSAGSDAASVPDIGIVCKQKINGKEVLGVKLNWNKRYITLCPIATIIGLAFRLYDPENYLGKGNDIGITCALIPADTEGVIKGRRHFPLNIGFLNGPTRGENVFVSLDAIIGGKEMVGQGWRMLMECLSAGRAISLPSSAVGGIKAAAFGAGAYARLRKQFNTSIGKFEGIEEPLARLAGNAYLTEAALTMTVNQIDLGEKPSVAGAIIKYHTTERARKMYIDAMDIHGGKGICLGPKNYLGRFYQTAPVAITVEGANILTRSLIIFGQGAIRCHPYIYSEMQSIMQQDLKRFDKAFWGHCSFFISNFLKSLLFNVTRAYFTNTPREAMGRYYQLIRLYSCHLAFLTDFSMVMLGEKLKRKEAISARLGDILSNLYLASAVLQRFYRNGESEDEEPIVEWCCQELFYACEKAIQGVINNFPSQWARHFLKFMIQPLGVRQTQPSDKLGKCLAKLLMEPGKIRSELTRDVFSENIENCPLGQLEAAFQEICKVEHLEKLMMDAVKTKKINKLGIFQQIEEAKRKGILTEQEAVQLADAELSRQRVIAVDDFEDSALRRPHLQNSDRCIYE